MGLALAGVATEPNRDAFAVDGLVPQVVACPKSVDELAAAVRVAADNGWAIIPRGGGTKMALGNIPRAADVVLCTAGLDQILEYEPADLVVTVQAGIRFGQLQRVLGEHGQFLALDPPMSDQVTAGGVIATNSSGPLRLRHGTVRDHLLGIKVVDPEGGITKSGGKVVKNVSGYDMGKLYTGSLGTLGLIVEASFKLTPLPPLQSTILAWFGELGDAFEAARTIFKTALPIRACELLSPTAAEDLGWPGGHLLAVWIGGGRAAVERQNRDVGGLCGAASRVEMLAADQIAPFWRAVEDFGRGEHLAIAKLSVLPSATGDLLGRLPAGSSWLSHVLSGVGYIFGSEAEGSLQTAREMGGYAILEACEPEVKRRLDVWGPPGPDFRLMERIKRQFDPNGMLNPGRYIGGL